MTRLLGRIASIVFLIRIRKFPVLLVLCVAALLGVSAAAPTDSLGSALAIAGVAAILLPFILKLVPAAGHYMVAICVGASLLIAVGAEVASGEIVLTKLQATDVPTLLAIFLSVEGLSQRVYSILTQSPKTAGAVE